MISRGQIGLFAMKVVATSQGLDRRISLDLGLEIKESGAPSPIFQIHRDVGRMRRSLVAGIEWIH